jgi:ElaB/YqjD/DUF883 family membrane-anchored ribosome-binding protein
MMEHFSGNEGEKLGKRTAEKIAGVAEVAGQKLDAAIDYVESTKRSAKQTLDQVCQDGWQGTKAKMIEYTRKEPFNALLIAVGTGLLLGFLTKKARG